MNVLVDTCVIIDSLQHRMPFAQYSDALCLEAASGKISGFITANSISDIYYILHRSLHDNNDAREALKKLCLSFGILDTTEMDCINALSSPVSDFEDAMMVETGTRCHIDCIVTRNTKDFKNSTLAVYEPDEFLENLNEEPKREKT